MDTGTLAALQPVCRHRGGLARTRQALRDGRLTIGFLGGSITDGRPRHNWPEPTLAWLRGRFPDVRMQVENAAIGATGSESAVFRVERDILAHDCDLVFVEYAVNDLGVAPAARRRTREGLIRKLLAGDGRDVVLVHTFSMPMHAEMARGDVPASIAESEGLAAHYGLGSVWMGLQALLAVSAGRLRWHEWLPDNLHPQLAGSQLYAEAVCAYLETELSGAAAAPAPTGDDRPAPLVADHWESATLLPLTAIEPSGPWLLRRAFNPWIDQVLDTSAPGARLRWGFTGRAVSLGLDFGKLTADFRWRLDDGEWQLRELDRPAWCGIEGWFRFVTLVDELPLGPHRLELEVVRPADATAPGTDFRLGAVGIVG